MSHFTVAVITKDGNIHRALERYNEQDENYFCSYPTPIKDLIEDYKKTYNTDNEEILKERIFDDYPNHNEENIYELYNPDARWDWCQVGGRWMGQLKVLKKSQHIIGERSLLDNTIEKKQRGKYRYVEGAKIKDVLWEQMNHQDFKSIKHNARFWEINVEGSPLKDGEDPKDYLNFYKKEYYKDLYGTKENYIMKQGLFYTYAMLIYDEDNGIDEWIEQGRMGFFGLGTENKNELESYLDIFYKIIHDPKYQDYYITIVDCHI